MRMLKPPTNLPKPTQENLGQYRPKDFLSSLVLIACVAWGVGTYLKFGDSKHPRSLFLFWANMGAAGVVAYLSIKLDGIRNLFGHIQYALNPSTFAQKAWAKQEDHKRAYEAEQQQLKTEAYWRGMTGFEFEENLCEVLKSQGIKAELTKKTADGGVDIWVTSTRGSIAIQCKAYKKQAGPAAVRELYGVMHGSKAIMGIVVCTGGFTSGAIDFANKNKGIYLADLRDVILMAKGDSKYLPNLR